MSDDLFIFLSTFVALVALAFVLWAVFKGTVVGEKLADFADMLHGEKPEDE